MTISISAGPGRLAGHVHQRDPAAADGAADIKRSETQSGHGGPGSATLRAWRSAVFWGYSSWDSLWSTMDYGKIHHF